MLLLHIHFAVIGCVILAQTTRGVTIYGQIPLGQMSATGTGSAGTAAYTGAAAYDPLVLVSPPVPTGLAPIITYDITQNLLVNSSVKQNGSFYGLSIEMSVTNQALGKNSSLIAVPFLNLMSNLVQRAGSVNIRVGGNSQELATLVDSIPDGRILQKDKENTHGTTETPSLIYTKDLFYMMSNISSMLPIYWYLGVPFFNTSDPAALDIMVHGEAIVGDHMLGFQVANEPDFYLANHHRPDNPTYGPFDYFGEFGDFIQRMAANGQIPVQTNLIGPSVASAAWTPEQVWDTDFIPTYKDYLKYLAVEHYPDFNCASTFGHQYVDPQPKLPKYSDHYSGQRIVTPYIFSTMLAQQFNKPFLMFETNTASCGGFPGISNSFVAALWALDYGLTMAYSNFTGANLHVGGQSVYYNPFTPPPTNQSSFHQWTVGPIFYSMMFVAEAFGKSGSAQVVDIYPNSQYQPNYMIYEEGKPSKLALLNWVSDNTTASDYTFSFTLEGGVPSQVRVKYLLAPFLTSKANITWAGQTFGEHFASDGRLTGTLNITTVDYDTSANKCNIRVPAPGAVLVFLREDQSASGGVAEIQSFGTTARTRKVNTATVEPSVLATSNGHSGKDRLSKAATSKGGLKSGAHNVVPRLVLTITLASLTSVSLLLGSRKPYM